MEKQPTADRYAAGQFNRETGRYDIVLGATLEIAIEGLRHALPPGDSGAIIISRHPFGPRMFPAGTDLDRLINIVETE